MTLSANLLAISEKMYAERPSVPLFHYTSIAGLIGITQSKALWASEVRYLNDAQELQHFGQLANQKILNAQSISSDAVEVEILKQFGDWIEERLTSGPLIFVGSLTEDGNLLSQWRGYCPHGQGVSLGFHPDPLIEAVKTNDFSLGRCIYDREQQTQVVDEVISAILSGAKAKGPAPTSSKHPTQSFHGIFDEFDGGILRIAALLKHPAFSEEREWRAVSSAFSNYVTAPIRHRPGKSMIVPFINLPLPTQDNLLDVPLIVVGPTPTPKLSIDSISQFLSKNASHSQPRIYNCCIPYRP